MAADDKRVVKLKAVLERLRRGKSVQNRQLRALLGDAAFAQFEDEWREQVDLRGTLRNKPVEVADYKRRLKRATFTYSKADAASRQNRRKVAAELFAKADTQFDRLAEYLREHIAGKADLEAWFDRSVHFDASNTPNGSFERLSFQFVCMACRLRWRDTHGVRRFPVPDAETIAGSCRDIWLRPPGSAAGNPSTGCVDC